MASGYIGKISAVVTANTSDLSKKLADAGNDTKRFSEQLNRSISAAASSAQTSLQKIFTPLQNLERRLQTSLKVPGLALPLDEIRQAVSLSEQINKPLADVTAGFQRLSGNVQAAFIPALQSAQDEAVKLNLLLQNSGSVSEQSLERARLAVEKLAAAQARLQQAQQMASRGMTGRELQFTDPRAYESLAKTAQLTQRAGSLPAAQLVDGSVARLVRELDRLQQVTQTSQAQLESLRLAPNVDTSALADAERRLERVLALARVTQDQLESAIAPPADTTAVTDQEIRALIEKERRAKQTEEAIYRMKKEIADKEIQDLIDRERRARQTEESIYNIKKEATDKEIQDLINRNRIAKELDAATQDSRASRFLTSFGGGSGGLSALFDERAIRSYSAQLQVLQDAISKASAEARGPAYTAFLKLRDAIADAMNRGELETAQTRDEIKKLTAEAVAATASVSGVGAKSLGRSVARAGDVGRAGFDKFSLAANQAAFAIDDFLSATGGIEFRLRAVQNNLTQLAFILGGTEGLFLGLGIAIAAQATIALVQFSNEGRTAEDVTKALNESLERQKTLAQELSDAFAAFATAARDSVFSDAAKSAEEFEGSLQSVIDKFDELIRKRKEATSPDAQEQRANANRANRLLASEENAGRRVLLISQANQATAAADLLSRREGSAIPLDAAIQRFKDAVLSFELDRAKRTDFQIDRSVPNTFPAQASANIERLISGVTTEAGLRSVIEARIAEQAGKVSTRGGISAKVSQSLIASDNLAANEIGSLTALLESLGDTKATRESLREFTESTLKASDTLADARKRLEDFGDGVDSLDAYSRELDAAAKTIADAQIAVSDVVEQSGTTSTGMKDLEEAIEQAAKAVGAEAGRRAQLVAGIQEVFNEEQDARRAELKKKQEDAARQEESDKKRAEQELRDSAERGRRLLLGERGRSREDLQKQIEDTKAAGGTAANSQQFVADILRSATPAVFALSDAAQNAILQGPSRQALTASDVTTQQGAAELARLLRGEDSAREQNIVELRRQTSELVEIKTALKATGVAD